MSSNRIQFVLFDPLTLPLPVSATEYSAIEDEDNIIFIGKNAKPFTENFMCRFGFHEEGYLKNASGDEDCSLFIKGHQKGNDFTLTIHVIGADRKEKEIIPFDPKAYLESFQFAFAHASSAMPEESFEAAFSVRYLKNTLSGHIEGNDDFWMRFYRDLDVATAPMNLLITRVQNGEELKEIIVLDQDEVGSFMRPHPALN